MGFYHLTGGSDDEMVLVHTKEKIFRAAKISSVREAYKFSKKVELIHEEKQELDGYS